MSAVSMPTLATTVDATDVPTMVIVPASPTTESTSSDLTVPNVWGEVGSDGAPSVWGDDNWAPKPETINP